MNALVFVLLLVTIPRMSSTFMDIDTWAIFGIKITALGEALVGGLGEYFITRCIVRCRQQQVRYRAEWKALDHRNNEQGRSTRKLETIPELRGSVVILSFLLLVLEGLTIVSQVPHFVSVLREVHIRALLPGAWLWGYVALLIVQPGVLQAALSIAISYNTTLRSLQEKQGESKEKRLPKARDLLPFAFERLLAKTGASGVAFEPEESKQKPKKAKHTCSVCGYEAKSRLALNGHMKAHRELEIVKGNGHHA